MSRSARSSSRPKWHFPGMAAAAILLAAALAPAVALAPASAAPAASGAPAARAASGAPSADAAPAARGASLANSTASCPWLNQSLPISQRVHLLLAQMTLANKINMVTGGGTSEPYVFYIPAIPSLCVPAMGEEDGPVGVGDGLTGVTELPSAASLAATFDPSLANQYGQVIGSEERGKGAMVNLGPTVNIDRDPRWGREFEAFTEDPVPEQLAGRQRDRRGAEPGRDVPGQALRGVQPGDEQEHRRGRRDRQPAGAARDLPARVLVGHPAGPRVLGDVRLQHDQRAVRRARTTTCCTPRWTSSGASPAS